MERKLQGEPKPSRKRYSYHTVNLPMNLAEKINKALEGGGVIHKNIPDFVNTAVIKLLSELEEADTTTENTKAHEEEKNKNEKENKLEMLKKALLNGEIDLKEYLELKKLVEENKIS